MLYRKRLSVLVIDDEPEFAQSMADYLQKAYGYRTYSFTDIATALDWYKTNYKLINLILADYKMPNSNKGEYLARFHAIKRKPVLIITGYPETYLSNHVLWDKALIKPCFKGLDKHIESLV